MDCLYAECTPMMTDCVMAELEKLGAKYRVALKVAKVWLCCPLALPTLLVLVSMSASMCKPFISWPSEEQHLYRSPVATIQHHAWEPRSLL